MRKPKPYKVTSKPILADRAAWRRAFNAWHPADSIDQPKWDKATPHPHEPYRYLSRWQEIENEKAAKRQRDLILYSLALAQKHGRLPADCRHLRAEVEQGKSVCFYEPDASEFPHAKRNPVTVSPRFLDWVPAEPVEELLEA